MRSNRLRLARWGVLAAVLAGWAGGPTAAGAATYPTQCQTQPGSLDGATGYTYNGASWQQGSVIAGFTVQAPSCVAGSYVITLQVQSAQQSIQSFSGVSTFGCSYQVVDPRGSANCPNGTQTSPQVQVQQTSSAVTVTFSGDGATQAFVVEGQLAITTPPPTSFPGYSVVSGQGSGELFCPSGVALGHAGTPGHAGNKPVARGGGAGGPGCGSNGGNGGCLPVTLTQMQTGTRPCDGTGSNGGNGGNGGNASPRATGGNGGPGGNGGYTTNAPGRAGGNGQNAGPGQTGANGAAGQSGVPTTDPTAPPPQSCVNGSVSTAVGTQQWSRGPATGYLDICEDSGGSGGNGWY